MHETLKTFYYDPGNKQQSQGKLWRHLKHVVDLILLEGNVHHEFTSPDEQLIGINCCFFTMHFDKYKIILPTNSTFIKT